MEDMWRANMANVTPCVQVAEQRLGQGRERCVYFRSNTRVLNMTDALMLTTGFPGAQ